jgi:hypothetical protein
MLQERIMSVQLRVTPSISAAARTNLAATGAWLLSLGVCAAADSPPAADALKLEPTQRAVDIDRPAPDQVAACTLSTHKENGQVGWRVESPDGVVLRWFVDTNGDNVLDRWSYYKDGLEVYRDMDTDFNRRVDQCRWFYAAGTRWGVDANEDGTIDQWRSISAEELSAELVDALVRRDPARIQPLLLSQADVESLGAGETLLQRLNQRREQAANQLAAFLKSQQAVTEAAKWASFAGSRPWLIPAGTDGAKKTCVCTTEPWSSSKTRAISSTLSWARSCKSARLGESSTCRVSSRQRTQLRTVTPPACFPQRLLPR